MQAVDSSADRGSGRQREELCDPEPPQDEAEDPRHVRLTLVGVHPGLDEADSGAPDLELAGTGGQDVAGPVAGGAVRQRDDVVVLATATLTGVPYPRPDFRPR